MASKQKKKRIKAVHQKLRLFRAKEPLLSIIMWGINHSITELSHVNIPVMLMPDEFKSFTKIKIDNHLFNKDNMPSHFKFKEWCPLVFRNLRERFGVDEDSYLISLTKRCPLEMDSSGRSGARFLLSYDKKYVIKTVGNEEITEMNRILKDYHQHIVERHAETLLPQFLGMYRVTVSDAETYMLIMKNIFNPHFPIHKKYDLKGSTVDRSASEKEKAKELPTFKDNDFISDGISVHLDPEERKRILSILEADSSFLASLNLMDYSLLVGIHDCDAVDTSDSVMAGHVYTSDENAVDTDDNNADDELEMINENMMLQNRIRFSRGSQTYSEAGDVIEEGAQQPLNISPRELSKHSFAIRSRKDSKCELVYFIALIDVLTHFGVKKRTAQAAKTVKHGTGAEISTVKPDQYAKRFMEFIEKVIV